MTSARREQRSALAWHIGQELADERKRRKMNQDAVGLVLGVHRNTLSRWEIGENPPCIIDFIRICDALACRPATIMDRAVQAYSGIKPRRRGKQLRTERDKPLTVQEERKLTKWPA
jgi:transcriptional regulator with XRE-family HTH domain